MTGRHPISERWRHFLEAIIRWIDIVIYALVIVGGAFAWAATPATVTKGLSGWEWMIPWWVGFLLAGGLLGLVGRISRVWIFEPPGTVLANAGIVMYFLILGGRTFDDLFVGLATVLALIASLIMWRRYVELQIFGTDPRATSFADRVADMLRRRTGDVSPRHR